MVENQGTLLALPPDNFYERYSNGMSLIWLLLGIMAGVGVGLTAAGGVGLVVGTINNLMNNP